MTQARRTKASVAALLALGLGAAACGGGSSHSPGVPIAGATANSSATTADNTPGTGLLAFASCMRSHGVTGFPDPSGSGGVPKPAVISAMEAAGDAKAEAAQTACNPLLPSGGLSGQTTQTIPTQDQQDYLKAAACMRSHGIPNFPDPTFANGSVSFNIPSSINIDSPTVAQARQTCEQLIPAGLPDSGRSG
jgi:hypothetical protein